MDLLCGQVDLHEQVDLFSHQIDSQLKALYLRYQYSRIHTRIIHK